MIFNKILEKLSLFIFSRAFKKNIFLILFRLIKLIFFIYFNKKNKIIKIKFGKNYFNFFIKNFLEGYGTRNIYLFRENYEPLLEFGSKFFKNGDEILDLGANNGVYSLAFSSVGKNVKVYAIEPFGFYKYNILKSAKLNNFKNIKFINTLISDRKKIYNLNYSRSYVTASIVYPFPIKTKKLKRRKVKKVFSTTIDKLVQKYKIKNLSFIKMDIEGAELLALEGAKKALKQHSPTIAMECSLEQFTKIKLPKYYKKFILNDNGELIKVNLNNLSKNFLKKNNIFGGRSSTVILINYEKLKNLS